ncbi:molybdenum cofactor guanylyltransferase [archaeon]|nr:molybdenum cofactor guanylyltransferase [archaeon]
MIAKPYTTTGKIMGITAIILAGGKSRRMGKDKRTLTLGNRSFLRAVYDTMETFTQEIIISYSSPLQNGEKLNAINVYDEIKGAGPLAGLISSLKAAKNETVAFAPVDAPAISPELYIYMINALESFDAVIPKKGNYIEPLIAVYKREEFLNACEKTLYAGYKHVRKAVERLEKVRYVDVEEFRQFDRNLLCLENVNTPQDYSRLKNILG